MHARMRFNALTRFPESKVTEIPGPAPGGTVALIDETQVFMRNAFTRGRGWGGVGRGAGSGAFWEGATGEVCTKGSGGEAEGRLFAGTAVGSEELWAS